MTASSRFLDFSACENLSPTCETDEGMLGSLALAVGRAIALAWKVLLDSCNSKERQICPSF